MNSEMPASLIAILARCFSLVAENEIRSGLHTLQVKAPEEAQPLISEHILSDSEIPKIGLHFSALRDERLGKLSIFSFGQAFNQLHQLAFEPNIFESSGSSLGKSLGRPTGLTAPRRIAELLLV